MAAGHWDSEFFKSVENPRQLAPIFDVLPGVFFYAKDREGRFTAINTALLGTLGLEAKEVLGETDYDLFDRDLADAYRREDHLVMESNTPVLNEPWWVPNVRTGDIHWYSASKIALKNENDEVVGIAGVMRPIEDTAELSTEHQQMTNVAHHIEAHFDERLTVDSLAEVANLSPRHFQRVFKKVFKTGAIEHLMRVRIRMAARRLVETRDSLSDIAIDCGFYDQAHFSNQFRRFRGLTPSAYRNQFATR